MSEPLFIQGHVHLSAGAYRRWLKSTAPAFEDLQPATAPMIVQDLLLAFLAQYASGDMAWLLCRHDEAAGQLQFAAALRYGREASSWTFAMQLVAAARSAANFKPRRKVAPDTHTGEGDYCFYGDAGAAEQAFALSAGCSSTVTMTAESPSWIKAWFDMLGKSPSFARQADFIDSTLLRAFKKLFNTSALAARPGHPVQVGFHFLTDGRCIWRDNPGRAVVLHSVRCCTTASSRLLR